jgi:hypothetical protein
MHIWDDSKIISKGSSLLVEQVRNLAEDANKLDFTSAVEAYDMLEFLHDNVVVITYLSVRFCITTDQVIDQIVDGRKM